MPACYVMKKRCTLSKKADNRDKNVSIVSFLQFLLILLCAAFSLLGIILGFLP